MKDSQIDQEIELSDSFFKLGAFATDYFSKKIILGLGGESFLSEQIPGEDCFFIKDFFTNHYFIYRPEKTILISREKFDALLGTTQDLFSKKTRDFDELYREDFRDLKKAFNEKLKKVVLISKEEYFTDLEKKELIRSLISKCLLFSSGHPYGFWNEDYGMIGNTPEYLYAIQDEKLFTHAIAGSAKREEESYLLQSKKDREEHQFVIQDLTEKLAPFSTSIHVHETKILPFQTMIHLQTSVEALLKKDWDHHSLISTLSPTAALGGYPTKEAMTFLLQTKYQDHHSRRYFGSALGVKFKNYHQAMVAIRNIQWNDQLLWIESGGGVIKDSQEEKELQEIQMKRAVIREHYLCPLS